MKKSVLILTLGASMACAPFFAACGSGSGDGTTTATTAATESTEDSTSATETTSETTPIVGGWTINTETKAHDMTTGDTIAFEAATKDTEYADLVPIAHVGDNLDDTIQYAFLCLDNKTKSWCIVNIEQSMDGATSKVVSKKDLDPNNLVTADGKDVYEIMEHWNGTYRPAAELPNEAQKYLSEAIKSGSTQEFAPVALLSTQVVAGMNYRILCSGDHGGYKNTLYAVDVYVDPQGKAEITDSHELWFVKYVTP